MSKRTVLLIILITAALMFICWYIYNLPPANNWPMNIGGRPG